MRISVINNFNFKTQNHPKKQQSFGIMERADILDNVEFFERDKTMIEFFKNDPRIFLKSDGKKIWAEQLSDYPVPEGSLEDLESRRNLLGLYHVLSFRDVRREEEKDPNYKPYTERVQTRAEEIDDIIWHW